MRARDLVEPVPTVLADDQVAVAVRVMGQAQLPGLIVVDKEGKPRTVLPGSQVLRLTVPRVYQEDPVLARTIDEVSADVFWQELGDITVAACLPRQPAQVARVPLDATVLEVAALMARLRSPLVAVVDSSGALVGAITLARLLSALAATAPDEQDDG